MADLAARFVHVRGATEALCAPLAVEDMVVQSMPDASPAKWHLAHTTWFFETFVLRPHAPGYTPPFPAFRRVFNSYYEGVCPPPDRARRGTQARPTVAEIGAWRRQVDEAMSALLDAPPPDVAALIELGLHHEQQHQELLVTDIKHNLLTALLPPVYGPPLPAPAPRAADAPRWIDCPGGDVEIGFAGEGFHFDNEGPVHRARLEPHALARELVSNAEFQAFVDDGGYARPALWLSDGWATVCAEGWRAPLYWTEDGAELTPAGLRERPADAPVAHVSFFEADAFARWAGARLPTEFEWEAAARRARPDPTGTFLDDGHWHPVGRPAGERGGPFRHLLGEVWEWTASPYRPYPRYRPPPGAVGEYNGKFMNGQYVLKGGSCATPRDHVRLSYRNFFAPEKRWQFTGIRLARDV